MMDDPFSFESTKFKCSFRRLLYLHKLVGDALDSVVVAEFRMSLLKLVSSDLFRGSNKGVDAEDATTPIDLFLFSDKLVEQEVSFNSMFGGELEVEGSLADDENETPPPIELVSIVELELELEVEWV
jgi:hypothetical protein